jgi:hypothetical protein
MFSAQGVVYPRDHVRISLFALARHDGNHEVNKQKKVGF